MGITRTEHDHVLLAGEAEPLPGELDITRPVEGTLHEIDVTGQVITGHLGRPWRLLQVWAAEAVHAPHERREHVGSAVGPDELERWHPLEYALGDHVHQVVQVVQRHEAEVLLVRAGLARRRRRKLDARAALYVNRDRQAGLGGGLPQGPVLRLAVQLTRLKWNPDLHYARMVPVSVDLAQRARHVVWVDPDGATELPAVFGVVEPARHHHLVVRVGKCGAEMTVRHDAPGHGMQDRDVDATVAEQMLCSEVGVGPWVLTLGSLCALYRSSRKRLIDGVFTAGRAIPVHLVVGEPAAGKRLTQEVSPQILVRPEEDVHTRVDHGRPGSVRVVHGQGGSSDARPETWCAHVADGAPTTPDLCLV